MQKKIFLGVNLDAMGLFALIFMLAILMKMRRKAMKKARDAIIVDTSFVHYSSQMMEKGFIGNDSKKTDSEIGVHYVDEICFEYVDSMRMQSWGTC